MKKNVPIESTEIQPSKDDVFRAQGMHKSYSPAPRVRAILGKALNDFLTYARPKGIFMDISATGFRDIYYGEGLNDDFAPLKNIYPVAEKLALFAITLGAEISAAIENLFKNNNYVRGYMLDAVASLGADNAAGLMENQYGLMNSGNSGNSSILVMGYSPGYCGWHISGQKRLFEQLKPESIGLSLNNSYLMHPLKSVTGILVQGQRNIHRFKPDFSFCRECLTHSCAERLKKINLN